MAYFRFVSLKSVSFSGHVVEWDVDNLISVYVHKLSSERDKRRQRIRLIKSKQTVWLGDTPSRLLSRRCTAVVLIWLVYHSYLFIHMV